MKNASTNPFPNIEKDKRRLHKLVANLLKEKGRKIKIIKKIPIFPDGDFNFSEYFEAMWNVFMWVVLILEDVNRAIAEATF